MEFLTILRGRKLKFKRGPFFHRLLQPALLVAAVCFVFVGSAQASSLKSWMNQANESANPKAVPKTEPSPEQMPSAESSGSMPDTFTNALGMTFKLIPAGRFMMGSPETEPGHKGNEKQHEVTISKPFYMMTTEVTNSQWKKLTKKEFTGNSPAFRRKDCLDCPVDNVSWEMVQQFIKRMEEAGVGVYRLPTEAEWEYAARAGSSASLANGDITKELDDNDPKLDEVAWHHGNSGNRLRRVAQKKPNAWGLYDMHGNTQELVQDYYDEEYPSGPVTDPTGPEWPMNKNNPPDWWLRVVRGGDYSNYGGYLRSAARNYHYQARVHDCSPIGFRLVMDPENIKR